MTYSRPGNRNLNIQAAGSSGNAPTVQINNDGSKVTTNAEYRDNTDPNLIYRNGMQKVDQINKILEFANQSVIPAISTEIDNKAQRDAGEVLGAYSAQEITSGGNQEAIDAYNNLSPLAQKTVIEAQTAQAVAMYPSALRGAYNNNPQVFSPGNSPEAKELRAVAKAASKAEAMEVAGLSKLPAFQTAQNAATLSAAEGQVSGELYRARINQEAVLRKAQLVQTGGTILSTSFRDIERGAATSEDGRAIEAQAVRGSLEQIVESAGETESIKGQLEVLAGTILEAGTTMNPAEKQQLLAVLKEQRNTPLLGVDDKTDLWNLPNDQGVTLSQALSKLELEAQVEADKYTYKQQGAKLLAAINSGDDAAAEAILANSFNLINDPANWMALAELKTKGENRVTSQMQTRENDIDEDVLNGKTTYTEAVKGILAGDRGQVGKTWLRSRLGIALKEVETGRAGVSPNKPAIDAYKSMKGDADNSLIDEQFRAQLLENVTTPKGTNGEYTVEARGFLIQAETDQRDAYIEIYNEKVAAGEPIDQLKIYKEATARALAKHKERAAASDTAGPENAAQALTSYTNTAQSAINKATVANGGKLKIPIEAISPSVQARLQEQNKSWDSLSEREQSIALASSFKGMTIQKGGKPVVIDDRMAADIARKILQQAKKTGANSPGPGVPRTVPVTEQEVQTTRSGAEISEFSSLPGYQSTVDTTLNILGSLKDFLMQDKVGFGKEKDNGEAIRKWFNNDGIGDQSSVYVDGFLNMIAGVQPATAAPLMYGTPDGLADFRQAWKYGSQGLKTGPLPQVAASAQARPVPTAVGNDQHELFVMIGVSEGTRTANGGYTKAYYGHSDPGDDNYNRGTVSGGRNSSASPEMVDQKWMGILTNMQQRMRPQLIVLGLMPGTQGYNRVMFNLMDLTVQSPKAAQDFAGSLFGTVREGGFTIEAIAKARADSFINPETGRLEASGFGHNYQALIKDQRSRAGVYDYRRRL